MLTNTYLRAAATSGGLLVLAWGLASPALASLFDVGGRGTRRTTQDLWWVSHKSAHSTNTTLLCALTQRRNNRC